MDPKRAAKIEACRKRVREIQDLRARRKLGLVMPLDVSATIARAAAGLVALAAVVSGQHHGDLWAAIVTGLWAGVVIALLAIVRRR